MNPSIGISVPVWAASNHIRSFAVVKIGGKVSEEQGRRGHVSESASVERREVCATSSRMEGKVLVPPMLEGVGMQYPFGHLG